MVTIGQFNRLEVVKQVDFGVYLDGEDLGTILLPKRYVPAQCALGTWLDVFIYFDSEDCLIATTQTPRICVGECAYLPVKQVNNVGAFMDWGLLKDLLVPFAEQLWRPQPCARQLNHLPMTAPPPMAAWPRGSRHAFVLCAAPC